MKMTYACFSLAIFAAFGVANASAACSGKKIYLAKGGDNGKYQSGGFNPGDTIVLTAAQNPYSYVSLDNIHGTAECPITITNEGGQVKLSNGFALSNSTYVRIRGNGTAGVKYGFHIEDAVNRAGVGVNIFARSANIVVRNLDITKKTYGFWVKQEADCDPNLQFPNWVIDHITIRDNRITQVGQEGMYLGSTSPNGMRTITCSGKAISPKPLRLGHVQVFNNIVDTANRGGIQLSGADHGRNLIYNNRVSNTGLELNYTQGGGIILGGYSNAYIHDNTVSATFNAGIEILGAGLVQIARNTIDRSGILPNKTPASGMASVFVDTRQTSPVVPTTFQICDNDLGANTDANVRIYDSYGTIAKTGNSIGSGQGTLAVLKGLAYTNDCSSLP